VALRHHRRPPAPFLASAATQQPSSADLLGASEPKGRAIRGVPDSGGCGFGGGDGVFEFGDGQVDAGPFVEELGGFLGHPDLEGGRFVDALGGGVFADVG